VEADDPLAHALEALAATVREPARGSLLEGAELRRASAGDAADAQTAKRVRASWASLLRLGEARAKLERNVRPAMSASAPAPTAAGAGPVAGSVAGGTVAGGTVAGGTVAGGTVAGDAPADGAVAGNAVASGTVAGGVGGVDAPAGQAVAPAAGRRSPAAEVSAMLDRQIADHVAALTRAYAAADTVHAAKLGLDDSALRSAETVGESLEEVGRAIVEVKGP
ncbi:MAG TPA: hypothetical protein VFS00_22430, partial [Polyangiaceae bacterium]|nr:hypothetical protein [Polyangiaceae bacterium]